MNKRTLATIGSLLVATFCLVGFGPPGLIGSDQSPSTMYADDLARANVPPPPAIQASAAAVVDGDTGQLVWGKNPHEPLPPASMTKMMTALVTLQNTSDLNEIVTSGIDASRMAGDSVMGLHAEERLSLHDLLYGMLVPSGDDAALVIARSVGGNESDFVAMMNQESTRLGLTDTHFVNPHGLDAPGHLSSPYDMIVIARAAMSYPLFRHIVATRHIVIQGRWTYDLTNTNYFLGRRPGVIGVKTGTTDLALHAITVADQQGDHVLYVTVMHTPNYVPDVTSLLDYFQAQDTWVDLTLPPSPLYQVGGGATPRQLEVTPATSAYLPTWQADDLTRQVDLTADAPVRATENPDLPDQNDGAATFYAGGAPIARLPLARR
ncbi:MAG: D-alanyl-D-alanine carboxypeptidase family protein [Chloroflexota bacterium]